MTEICTRERKKPIAQFAGTNGWNNPKTRNPVSLSPCEYSVTERIKQKIDECCQGQWYNKNC